MKRLCAFGVAVISVLAALSFAASAQAATASWSFSPSTYDFGIRLPETGPSAPQAFTLTNTGDVALTPSFVSIDSEVGAGFHLAGNNCGLLAPGDSCSVNATFNPPSAGHKEATLEVSEASAKVAPAVATLTGTGEGPAVSIDPASVDFGSLRLGTAPSTARVVTVANEGPLDLAISTVSLRILSASKASVSSPEAFQLTGGSCEAGLLLPPAGACTLGVAFSPTAQGLGFLAELRIADNAADSPQVVPLSGSALPVPGPLTIPPPSPRAVLSRHPGKHTKARSATFALHGSPPVPRFLCKLDGQTFHACESHLYYRDLRLGWHRFAARAVDANGLIGATTTVYRWRIAG